MKDFGVILIDYQIFLSVRQKLFDLNLSELLTGEIQLVALAPLTNVGVALRMDPEFSNRLQSLVIMGGNMHGVYTC